MSLPRFLHKASLITDVRRFARTYRARSVAERMHWESVQNGMKNPVEEIRRQRLFSQRERAKAAHGAACEILADSFMAAIGFDPSTQGEDDAEKLLDEVFEDAKAITLRRSA